MPSAWSPCTRCAEPAPPGQSRCDTCRAQADRDRRPHGNPYRTPGHTRFREAVLARQPRCVCVDCEQHAKRMCGQVATVADHHPIDRTDLELMGADPNDPQHGRGVCKPCHDRHTAATKPSGWNARA